MSPVGRTCGVTVVPAGSTVSNTAKATGEFAAPDDDTRICPLYCPAASPAVCAETMIVENWLDPAVLLPLDGWALSQPPAPVSTVDCCVQFSVLTTGGGVPCRVKLNVPELLTWPRL